MGRGTERWKVRSVFIITDKEKTRRGGGRRCRFYERRRSRACGCRNMVEWAFFIVMMNNRKSRSKGNTSIWVSVK
jgi:hypothetical protein